MKFKIGDKVKTRAARDPIPIGSIGVVESYSPSHNIYRVWFRYFDPDYELSVRYHEDELCKAKRKETYIYGGKEFT